MLPINNFVNEVFFNTFDRSINKINIVTLGPKGTSSENSAFYFGELMVREKFTQQFSITLCNTYEEVSDVILNDRESIAIVANAYHGINKFYMNLKIELYAAFLKNTPNYGIAILEKNNSARCLNIATHPAPVALIEELLPKDYSVKNLELKNSTSIAAESASLKEVDAALTTEVAAKLHNLIFISKVRPIQMLWSVFVNVEAINE